MTKIKKLSVAIGISVLMILMNISISGVFIGLLLGMLIIPPVLVLTAVLKEGAPIMVKEFNNLIDSGKGFLVISISKETIILQPEFK